MKLILVFLMLTVCACGQKLVEQRISDELVSYVDEFKDETGIYFTNTDIYLAYIPLDKTEAIYNQTNGICYAGIGTNNLLINYEMWTDAEERVRCYVLAHEIGHCVLGLPHNNKKLDDGCPASIMYPITEENTASCFGLHKAEYYEELKKQYKKFGSF